MNRRRLVPILPFVITVAILAAGSASAQTEIRTGLSESVEVNLMLLNVSVVDRTGAPVTGLPAEAFRVEVEGKPLAVSYVDEVARGAKPSVPSPESLEKMPAGEAPAATPAPIPVPRYISIFVDSRGSLPDNRSRALTALREFVLNLGPDDQVQLLNFGGTLEVVRPWTTSRESLMAGLAEIATKDPGGTRRQSLMQLTLSQIRDRRNRTQRASIASNYARQVEIENRELMDALTTALRDLSGQPGRRAIVLVTDGFEMRPGEQMMESAVGKFGANQYGNPTTSLPALEAMTKKANGEGVALYTVDSAGLRTSDAIDASVAPSPAGWQTGGIEWRMNMTDGMLYLAKETGGSAHLESNALEKGFAKIADELSNFYQLGIRLPAGARVDEYRAVKVLIEGRKDVEVHFPRGWAGLSAEDRVRRQIESAFSTGHHLADLTPKIEVSGAAKSSGFLAFRSHEVGIAITLPAAEPAWKATGDLRAARLRVYVEAIDDRGRHSDLAAQDWPVSIPATGAPETLRYTVSMKMREGNSRILVAVRDLSTGKIGSTEFPIHVE